MQARTAWFPPRRNAHGATAEHFEGHTRTVPHAAPAPQSHPSTPRTTLGWRPQRFRAQISVPPHLVPPTLSWTISPKPPPPPFPAIFPCSARRPPPPRAGGERRRGAAAASGAAASGPRQPAAAGARLGVLGVRPGCGPAAQARPGRTGRAMATRRRPAGPRRLRGPGAAGGRSGSAARPGAGRRGGDTSPSPPAPASRPGEGEGVHGCEGLKARGAAEIALGTAPCPPPSPRDPSAWGLPSGQGRCEAQSC